MKIVHIKQNKQIDKSRYISHKNQESFILQTLPSFAYAYNAYKRQKVSNFLDSWVTKTMDVQKDTSNSLAITWLGHASFLMQYNDITILTDPVFGSLPLFPRLTTHGLSLDHLPPIDFILLSHNHRDHMDFSSLSHLAYRYKNVHIAVPHGDARWLPRSLFSHVHEHAWHDELISESLSGTTARCVFLPAYHWSRRGLFDTNHSLWGSWIIQLGQHTIYFGGDSAYFEHFQEIGIEYQIDIALLPIAPIQPLEWMSRSHMSPADAGQAFFDLNAKIFIPMHWGTFQFGTDNHEDPVHLMRQWEKDNKILLNTHNKRLNILKIGDSLTVSS